MRPVSRRRSRLEMNMTPMIDVVFLLIIFFLLSSHLAKQEVQAEMNLPSAATGDDQLETDAHRITINVVPEAERYVIKLGADPVEIGGLKSRLGRAVSDAGKELEIRIRSDESVPYRVIEPIMITCARLGIWNVKFAVIRPDVNKS